MLGNFFECGNCDVALCFPVVGFSEDVWNDGLVVFETHGLEDLEVSLSLIYNLENSGTIRDTTVLDGVNENTVSGALKYFKKK
jgi:hypothetical protein